MQDFPTICSITEEALDLIVLLDQITLPSTGTVFIACTAHTATPD